MQAIAGTTKLLGVMGNPVEHSLSPVMHNAAIAHLGLDYVYVPFPVRSEDLEKASAGLAAIGVVGFNITIPHKEAILPFLAEISATARLVGAVNTVWRTERGWGGTNTDVVGFLSPLKPLARKWQSMAPVILGSGGAARAAVVGCGELGCPEIHIVGRDRLKLAQFRESWTDTPLAASLKVHTWEELPYLLPHTQLLVNATPVGMVPQIDRSPLAAESLAKLSWGAIAYDLIYSPRPTRFLQQAQQQGAIAIDGLAMLVQQGAAALQIWLGQPVPVEVMSQALERHLQRLATE